MMVSNRNDVRSPSVIGFQDDLTTGVRIDVLYACCQLLRMAAAASKLLSCYAAPWGSWLLLILQFRSVTG